MVTVPALDRKSTAGTGIPSGRSTQFAAVRHRLGRMTAARPERTVTKIGSGRSPETLEYEKLPFAMLLRYCGLNGPYAACRLSGN
jgi:hypothetical protein